jgi:hypothetical protein
LGSVPGTSVTFYTEHMGNTLAPKGLSRLVTVPLS